MLVTGCGSGIGLALARRLVEWNAARIVLTARERALTVLDQEGFAPDDRIMAMPTMGAYSASKFALEGASESMWYEMRPWNVHVTLVQPGLIRSDSPATPGSRPRPGARSRTRRIPMRRSAEAWGPSSAG